jgi:hypothetical protein
MKSIILSLLVVLSLSSCSNYGKKVKSGNIEVFYKEGITEDQAKKTAELFDKSLKENGSSNSGRKSFQLSKPGDTVILKMVASKDKVDQVPEESFYEIARVVSENVFNDQPVNLLLTDKKLNPYRTLVYKKTGATDKFGELTTSGNVEVYYNDGDATIAEQLADHLNNLMQPANKISFQFSKNEDNVFVIKMVTDPSKVSGITEDDLKEVSAKISNEVFNGAPLVFHLTDSQFEPLKTYNYPGTAQPDPGAVNQ